MRSLLFAMCVVLILGAQVSSGQQITVRVINGNTGQPFITKARKVEISNYDSMPSPTNRSMNKVNPDFQVAEGLEGTAAFKLSQPYPPVVCANPDIPFHSIVVCAKRGCFWTPKVLSHGVAPKNTCDPKHKHKLEQKFTPKPGEIILFVRRYTFWDTL